MGRTAVAGRAVVGDGDARALAKLRAALGVLLPRVARGFGPLAGKLLAAPGEHEEAATLVEAVDVLLGLLYVLVDLVEALLHAVELLCTRKRTPALISILHLISTALSNNNTLHKYLRVLYISRSIQVQYATV